MFAYQIDEGESLRKDRFFNRTEHWKGRLAPDALVVVACALMLGAASRLLTMVPMAACVATLLVLAWTFAERATAEEPGWVGRLSLASTGMLYLGIGHCLGLAVVPLVAVATVWRRGG